MAASFGWCKPRDEPRMITGPEREQGGHGMGGTMRPSPSWLLWRHTHLTQNTSKRTARRNPASHSPEKDGRRGGISTWIPPVSWVSLVNLGSVANEGLILLYLWHHLVILGALRSFHPTHCGVCLKYRCKSYYYSSMVRSTAQETTAMEERLCYSQVPRGGGRPCQQGPQGGA